jgi:hypothetical protein
MLGMIFSMFLHYLKRIPVRCFLGERYDLLEIILV